MREISVWTWTGGDGARYAPGAVPALWRRIADLPNGQDAKARYGLLADHGQHIDEKLFDPADVRAHGGAEKLFNHMVGATDHSDWRTLHYRLKAAAKLWQPEAENPQIFYLAPFSPLQHSDIAALRATTEMIFLDEELVLRLDGWRIVHVPLSLRAFLLAACVTDIGAKQRFRRCDHCQLWFPVSRNDQRFCTNVCRAAAHHAASKAAQ